MTLRNLPQFIREYYEVREWKHASAILESDFPEEWKDIIDVLIKFRLKKSAIKGPGGGKSPIAKLLDHEFRTRDWQNKRFQTKMVVDSAELENPTHEIDCYKNRVALGRESNDKGPSFGKYLNKF